MLGQFIGHVDECTIILLNWHIIKLSSKFVSFIRLDHCRFLISPLCGRWQLIKKFTKDKWGEYTDEYSAINGQLYHRIQKQQQETESKTESRAKEYLLDKIGLVISNEITYNRFALLLISQHSMPEGMCSITLSWRRIVLLIYGGEIVNPL